MSALCTVFCLGDETGMMWARRVSCRGKVLVGTSEGKRQLGRPRHRREDNIKIDLKDIFWYGVNWTDLTKDRDR